MAAVLPVEQRSTYLWMCARLYRKEWTELANRIPNSVEKIMKAPVLSSLISTIGKARVKECIEARLIWLVAQSNVANNMNSIQINFAADTLLERYPNESLADFLLCFKRGAQGYYGSTYHQLDTSVIMSWMEKHLQEKAMYIERDLTTAKKTEDDNEPIKIDYEAHKKRVEDKRRKDEEDKNARIEAKKAEIYKEDGFQSFRETYKPLTAEQLRARELHDRYLRARGTHEKDPHNRDATGAKLIKPFKTEAEWIEEQKIVEALKNSKPK
jgi:hypothetical protein